MAPAMANLELNRWLTMLPVWHLGGVRGRSILEGNAGRAGRGSGGLGSRRGSRSAGHCDGDEMCTELETTADRRHEEKCRDDERLDDRVGDDGMDLAQARQKGANRVGQFKFFEVFTAAECRQIPCSEGSCHLGRRTPGVLGSGAEKGRFYWTGREPRGPQPASIGYSDGRG